MNIPVYFTRPGRYMNGLVDVVEVTQEDVDKRTRFFIEKRKADTYLESGAVKPYVVDNVVHEVVSDPLWKQYLTRQGANTKSEKAYLVELCSRLGAVDAEDMKRAEMRKILEDAEKNRPNVLDSAIAGKLNLQPDETPEEVFQKITDGEDDTFDYDTIIGG